jgi:hypothetical protein
MRRVVLGLGVVLLVVAAALGVAFVYRLPLAAAGLRYGLARAGFADARFAIERLDAAGATVTGIEAGERLRIDRLDVTFDFHRLPQPPVERVHVAGARLELPNAAPAGEGTTQEPTPSSGFPVALLPALELENVIVVIPSTIGPISVRLDSTVERQEDTLRMRLEGALESGAGHAALRGEARLDPGGTVSMSVQIPSLSVHHPRLHVGAGSVNARFEGEASGLDVRSANGQIELTLKDVAGGGSVVGDVVATLPITLTRESSGWAAKLANADLRLPAEALHFGAISADGSSQSAELRVDRIEDTARERRFEPLSLHLKLLEIQPAPRFSADLKAANGRAALHAEGRYDPSSVGAKIDVSLPRLAFDPAGLKLTDLSPRLESAGAAKGAVEGTAHLQWTAGGGVNGTASLGFDRFSLDTSRMRIDDLVGQVNLVRLIPPQTAGMQTARAHELHPGVAFSDAALRWALEPVPKGMASRLRIEGFEAGFADGRIALRDALLDPLAAQNRLDFRLEEVDVARLFEIASLEGVSGTGRLSGTIPVIVRQGAVAIEKSELAAHGGVLQMRSQKVASILAGGGQPVELLLDVLKDFHYDDLTVTIEKEFAGEAAVRLHLEGHNPSVLQAQTFRINLNVTGNLDRLVGSLLEIARLSDRAVRATIRGVNQEAR